MSLTPPERKTVILLSDADDTAVISTYQRRIITKLQKNPLANKTADLSHGSTIGAEFEMPNWAISFLTRKRKASSRHRESLEKARAARKLYFDSRK